VVMHWTISDTRRRSHGLGGPSPSRRVRLVPPDHRPHTARSPILNRTIPPVDCTAPLDPALPHSQPRFEDPESRQTELKRGKKKKRPASSCRPVPRAVTHLVKCVRVAGGDLGAGGGLGARVRCGELWFELTKQSRSNGVGQAVTGVDMDCTRRDWLGSCRVGAQRCRRRRLLNSE
jgi:hypothetical protein